jgi:uncharacterized protein (DUF1697 family)
VSTVSTRYVSLLRGINLGKTRQVSMPELAQVYAGLGLTDVATYIRSGNVVFTSDLDADEVCGRIERAVAAELSMDVDVVVRTHAEMAGVLARNPFPRADPAHLAVVFLAGDAPADLAALVGPGDLGSDEYAGDGREIYLHLPNGFGRSKLATRMSALRHPVVGTVRNWRTVGKLVDMSA